MNDVDPMTLFPRLRALLELEAEAEREQATQRTAERDTLPRLRVHEEDAGFGGRLLLRPAHVEKFPLRFFYNGFNRGFARTSSGYLRWATGLARRAAHLASRVGPTTEIVEGDVTDAASLAPTRFFWDNREQSGHGVSPRGWSCRASPRPSSASAPAGPCPRGST